MRGTPSPESGANVSRRPSERQQEKSPESSAPHPGVDAPAPALDVTDDAGPAEDVGPGPSAAGGDAGGDSRFHEAL